MRKRLLKTLIAGVIVTLGGIGQAKAQSTYKWNASQWAADGGYSITQDAENNTFTTTGYQWGCCSLTGTLDFKLPKRQTYLVVKGTNIYKGTSNPCLNNVNDTNIEAKPKLTVNDAGTVAYVDITPYLDGTTDFFGNIAMRRIGLYLQEPTKTDDTNYDAGTTVTSIDFVTADALDAATAVTVKGGWPEVTGDQIATDVSLAASEGEFKKSLSFKQVTTNGDMGIVLTVNQQLNSSDVFFIVESNGNNNLNESNRLKLRSVTVDGKEYENDNGGAAIAKHDLGDGHYLYLHNFFTNSDTSAELLSHLEQNQTATATKYLFYVNNAQNSEVTLYRAGFYNLAEILQLYPSLASQAWRFQHPKEGNVAVELGGTANKIIINNKRDENTTQSVAYTTQLVRSLGALPEYFTGLELDKIAIAAGEKPLREDIFRDLPYLTDIIFGNYDYKYFPTMNANVNSYYVQIKYSQFKDGVAPGSVSTKGDGAQNNPRASLTRQFVAGYSSLVLPFDVTVSDLTALGITPYTVNTISESSVSFTEATGTVSANTPFIVNVAEAGLYLIPSADVANIQTSFENYYAVGSSDAKFVGSYVQQVPDDDYASTLNFGLKADGTAFARMGGETKTNYYRAFLALPASAGSRSSVAVTFGDGETTGIGNSSRETMADGRWFDLQGRQVVNGTSANRKLARGLYIINGKKVLVK